MSNNGWDGKTERRTDETSVRLALLEKGQTDQKDSLISVHKRITEIRKGVEDEVKQGLAAIFAKLEVQQGNCARHNERTAKIESNVGWMFKWLGAASTAIVGIGTFLFHWHTKK